MADKSSFSHIVAARLSSASFGACDSLTEVSMLNIEFEAYHDYVGMLSGLSTSVKSMKNSDCPDLSKNVEKVLSLLGVVESWMDDIPPIDQPQRFGNKAYRIWHEKLKENITKLIADMLKDESLAGAEVELSPYIIDSFGNATRIDYGTGHECAFGFFLCCLFKLHFLKESDTSAVVLRIFKKYVFVCRRLQTLYKMEPAGSQGVWSLDDFQFLPFYFGSSQLLDHPQIDPSGMADESAVHEFADEYLFLEAIRHILHVGFLFSPFMTTM